MSRKYRWASMKEVCGWLVVGHFEVRGREVWKIQGNPRRLRQNANRRRGCCHGDLRVDLFCNGARRSVNVSCLVWMTATGEPPPPGWHIHHMDEDPNNNTFENLLCLHPTDHQKLHAAVDVPF